MYRLVLFISCIGYDAVLDAEGLDGAPRQFPELVARAPEGAEDLHLGAKRDIVVGDALVDHVMWRARRNADSLAWLLG